MSNRNARRTAPAAKAVKAASKSNQRRRHSVASSSTFDLSSTDNDNYSGLDDISDDEDDDEDDVVAVEERNIMEEASPSPSSSASTPRPRLFKFDDVVHDGDDYDESNEDLNDESGSPAANDFTDDEASWPGIASDVADLPTQDFLDAESELVPHRRVRFNVPADDDSSSESTEDDNAYLFPDIFIDQSTLDPNFRRQIENEHSDSSNSDSYWDHTWEANQTNDWFDGDPEDMEQVPDYETEALIARHNANIVPFEPSTPIAHKEMEEEEYDGYESDSETTEDEEVPVPPIKRKTRRPSITESEASVATHDSSKRPRDQPRATRFSLDKSSKKPIAVYNTKTGKVMIFTPNQQRHPEPSHVLSTPVPWLDPMASTPVQTSPVQMTPFANDDLYSGMTPGNLFDDYMLFFGTNPADESSTSFEGSSPTKDSDPDPENELEFSDFVHFGNDESSNDEGDGENNWDPSSTPLRPTTASSDADVLSHLNPSTVGAFRRNQVNSQLMIRNQTTQDSLDFSGPYNNTAIKGIRSDRFDTAGVPLTPIRRHKKQMSDIVRSPLEGASAKRKAMGDMTNGGHKKQKSISDVGSLQL